MPTIYILLFHKRLLLINFIVVIKIEIWLIIILLCNCSGKYHIIFSRCTNIILDRCKICFLPVLCIWCYLLHVRFFNHLDTLSKVVSKMYQPWWWESFYNTETKRDVSLYIVTLLICFIIYHISYKIASFDFIIQFNKQKNNFF